MRVCKMCSQETNKYSNDETKVCNRCKSKSSMYRKLLNADVATPLSPEEEAKKFELEAFFLACLLENRSAIGMPSVIRVKLLHYINLETPENTPELQHYFDLMDSIFYETLKLPREIDKPARFVCACCNEVWVNEFAHTTYKNRCKVCGNKIKRYRNLVDIPKEQLSTRQAVALEQLETYFRNIAKCKGSAAGLPKALIDKVNQELKGKTTEYFSASEYKIAEVLQPMQPVLAGYLCLCCKREYHDLYDMVQNNQKMCKKCASNKGLYASLSSIARGPLGLNPEQIEKMNAVIDYFRDIYTKYGVDVKYMPKDLPNLFRDEEEIRNAKDM